MEIDCDRDNYMSAEEAKTYGLVDEVVKSRKEVTDIEEGKKEEKSYIVFNDKGLGVELLNNEVRTMFIFQPQMK